MSTAFALPSSGEQRRQSVAKIEFAAPSSSSCKEESPWTVSYTHLDVYKRQDLIKKTIQEITGVRYGIGPYKKKGTGPEKASNIAQQTLQSLEQQGVEVIYEDESIKT